MIRTTVYGYHVALNADDAVDQTDLDVLRVQNRTLLDVRLQEVSDGAVRPLGLADALRVQTVALHRIIDGDAVGILEILAVLDVAVAEHGARTEITGTEAHALFVAEADRNKVALARYAALLQLSGNLNRADDAGNAVVITAIDDRVVVRTHHDTRSIRIFALQNADHVARCIFRYLEAGFRHELLQKLNRISRFLGKRKTGAAFARRRRILL